MRLSLYNKSSRNLPRAIASFRSAFVADMTRTLDTRVSLDPSGSYARSCKTRSIFTWQAGSRSPISSRKIVPPFAVSNLREATEKDPRPIEQEEDREDEPGDERDASVGG